ncbi:MAG: hypothetical protein HYY76_14745, partial [Acidobacteria bacterium]|nr:hypothetical protein [Acidobacteriota bacterium]
MGTGWCGGGRGSGDRRGAQAGGLPIESAGSALADPAAHLERAVDLLGRETDLPR